MKKTKKRKLEHLDVCVKKSVEVGDSLFHDVALVHNCLPEMDMAEADTRVKFLGKKLEAPLMIAAITGGVAKAGKINKGLAGVAEELGIGFGLGSQRAMLEDPKVWDTYYVRKEAPKTLVLGNIGAAQLANYNALQIKGMMKRVKADAICVHLNAAQEAAQAEGDLEFAGCLKNIGKLSRVVPIVAKETGNGVSREAAYALKEAGVQAIDVGGYGGTSWVKVDSIRARKESLFYNWGIPTTASVLECRGILPLIATGGVRDGLDAAKAIALGADVVGTALPVLKWYDKKGVKGVRSGLEQMISELRTAMFLTGSKNIRQLQNTNVVIGGGLAGWAYERGIDTQHFGTRRLSVRVI